MMDASIQATGSDAVRPRHLFRAMRRGWRWIALAVFCTLGLAIAYILLVPPKYSSEVTMLPVDSSQQGGGLAALASQFGGMASLAGINLGQQSAQKAEALETLRSDAFARDFISHHNLMPNLFPNAWDPVKKDWRPDKKTPTLIKAQHYFSSRVIHITEDKKTSLVTVQMLRRDPEEAARWVNEFVQEANAKIRDIGRARAKQNFDYLSKEIRNTEVLEVRDAMNRLMESQIKTLMIANVGEEFAFRVVDRGVAADLDMPAGPGRALIIIIAIFLGVFFGSLVAIAIHLSAAP